MYSNTSLMMISSVQVVLSWVGCLWIEVCVVKIITLPEQQSCEIRCYCEADLRLCFRLSILLVFPCGGSYIVQ